MTAVFLALWLAGVIVCVVGLYVSLVVGLELQAATFALLLALLVWELIRPWRPQP